MFGHVSIRFNNFAPSCPPNRATPTKQTHAMQWHLKSIITSSSCSCWKWMEYTEMPYHDPS